MRTNRMILAAVLGFLLSGSILHAAEWGLKPGTPEIQSAGPLAFGPDGILFVGDLKNATIFAIGTGDTKGNPAEAEINVSGINAKLVAALKAGSATINDLAVNPLTGRVFLSVTKSDKAGSVAAIVKVGADGRISPVSLTNVPFQKVSLPNAPPNIESIRNGRPHNPRSESITDLAYAEGKVYVSGLADGPSPSTVREIPFPFSDASSVTSVEIFHGAHGKVEDSSAIRAFVPINIDGEASLLAGFTCTPLVRFPIKSLKSGEKTRGTTVAELGNRNRPLDMIVYQKDGKNFLLMANSARGVMKISTDNITRADGITEPVRGGGTAGQTYDTIKELDGVVQLDRLNNTQAVILVTAGNDSLDLRTIALP